MERRVSDKEKRKLSPKRNILDEMDPNLALEIVYRLASESEEMRAKIDQMVLDRMKGVDADDVAADLFSCLDSLRVEDVWDNSGKTRYGYVDPTDYALEMFENELEPFLDEMRRYRKLSMHEEASNYCMGILLGLHRFEGEATTEYADWAVDAPHDFFTQVLEAWNRECKRKEDKEAVNSFVRERFHAWWAQFERCRLEESSDEIGMTLSEKWK